MISADFTINGASNPAAHVAAYGSTVTLDLLSYVGATSITWNILGCSDPGTTIPTITKSGTPQGKTATFVMPADPGDGLGRSFLVQCIVSTDIQDSNKTIQQSVSYGVVGAENSQGILPIAPGEENYRHATHGWGPVINNLLNQSGGGGGGGSGDVVGPVSSVDNRIVLFSGTSGKIIKQATPLISDVILKNGTVTYTADQSMGGFKVTNVATPTASTDAANKSYVDSAVLSGTDLKPSVRVATTANITLSGTQTIDGIAVIAGDRVLVKNQTTASQNGIYVVAAGAWSRATDADTSAEVTCGMMCILEEGAQAAASRIWILTTANPITLGTTSLTFATVPTVISDGTTITNTGGTLSVTTNGIGNTQLRQGVGLSVIGRATNTTGNVADIVGTDGQALRVSGTTLGFGTLVTAAYTDASVTYSKIQNGTGLSVVGRAANTSGVNADIVGTDGQALRVSGTALGFGTLATAAYTNSSVTYAKIQNVSATDRLLGRDTTGAGVIEELTVGGGIEFTGSVGLQRSAISGDVTIAAGSNTAAITAGVIVDADINASAAISISKLGTLTALSVLANATNAAATPTALTAGTDGHVLMRSGTSLVFAPVAAAAITNNSVTYAKIQQGAGLSVIGRAANTAGDNADIIGTDGQALRVSGTTLGFGTLATAAYADASVTYTKIQNVTSDRLLGRDTGTVGGIEEISVTGGIEFTGSSSIQRSAISGDITIAAGSGTAAITAGVIVNADINTSAAIALSKLATQAALTVVANATNAVAVPTAVAAASDGQVFLRSGTSLVFGSITTAGITNNSVTYAKIQQGTGLSVVGRSTSTAGDNADIVGSDGQVLRVLGSSLGFGTIATAGIGDNQVTLAKLATQAALTVLANATNAVAVPTAVAASADGQVFLRSGTSLAFGTIGASSITDATITVAKLADLAAMSVLGRAANTSGPMAAITATANQVLRANAGGTSIGFGQIVLGAISNGSACSIVGRSANSAGVYADISIGTNDHVLMRTANVVTSGFIANANVATAAAIAGTKITPDFGSQNITTTGLLSLGTTPASSGIIRIPNNQAIVGKTSGGTDVGIAVVDNSNILYIGSSLIDTTIRGLNVVDIEIAGGYVFSASNNEVIIQAASGTMIHAVALSGPRRILGLCGSVSLTEMPSNTGDGVAYLANATVIPTANPVNGYILFATTNGVYVRGPNGTVTQIALP